MTRCTTHSGFFLLSEGVGLKPTPHQVLTIPSVVVPLSAHPSAAAFGSESYNIIQTVLVNEVSHLGSSKRVAYGFS